MKEPGTVNWTNPNTGGNNNSGFAGLPGSFRYGGGSFDSFDFIGVGGSWWSYTVYGTAGAWYRSLGYNGGSLDRSATDKRFGFSVRCLRD